jgi:hypothetical protein
MKMILKLILALTVFLESLTFAEEAPKKEVKKIIFEDQRIEGKIRRPQLVLIKAEQRPEFSPMILQSFGVMNNIANVVNDSLIEQSPYNGPFIFDGTSISNYIP